MVQFLRERFILIVITVASLFGFFGFIFGLGNLVFFGPIEILTLIGAQLILNAQGVKRTMGFVISGIGIALILMKYFGLASF